MMVSVTNRRAFFPLMLCGATLFVCCTNREAVATNPPPLRRDALIQLATASFPIAETELRLSPPRQVLVVDASCPFSMHALAVLGADSALAQRTAIAYMPQTLRDGAALLETASLECARRDGKLAAYVSDRLARLDSTRRPVLASAVRVGMDSLSFLSCVESPSVASAISHSSAKAASVGVWNLPVLVGLDSAWIGTQAVRRLGIKNP